MLNMTRREYEDICRKHNGVPESFKQEQPVKPKSAVHANLGMRFEQFIETTNQAYERMGKAMIYKQATEWKPIRNAQGQISSAKVKRKSIVDFLGRIGSNPIAFDAKDTQENRMRFDRVEQHQAFFLDGWINNPHAVGFILVSFGPVGSNLIYVVPWAWWSKKLESYHMAKRLRKQLFEASFCPEDLQKEWRVFRGDYLAAVEQITVFKNRML